MSYGDSGADLPRWTTDLVSPLDDRLGVVVHEVSARRCVVSAPVSGNTQPAGRWHGGASGVLVETAGSLAAIAHARCDGRAAVGTELSVSHLRSPNGPRVRATAAVVHLGRTSATYVVELEDGEGRVCASGRLTCRFVDPADR